MKGLILSHEFGQIRTEKKGEQFLFCAADVCEVLELEKTESSLRKLDDDEKLMLKVYASGQNREMWFVTESGLYALIMRSNKPEARKFRKWITSEVLPSLRKYGVYSVDKKVMEKAEARYEKRAVAALLSEMRESLSETDVRLAAVQCRTDKWYVLDVLNGRREDAYMLVLLYARSTGNKLLRRDFYTGEGAERLLAEVRR